MGLWQRGSDGRGTPWKLSFTIDTGSGPGQVTISTGCSDKRAAEEVERRVRDLVDRQRAGLRPDSALLAWLERIPNTLRRKLIARGLAAADAAALGRSVSEHIADYLTHCQHHGQSRFHVHNKKAQLARFAGRAGVRRLVDIQRDTVASFLQELGRQGKSARTINQHQTTIVAFLNWCVDRGRLLKNPATRLMPSCGHCSPRFRSIAGPSTLSPR